MPQRIDIPPQEAYEIYHMDTEDFYDLCREYGITPVEMMDAIMDRMPHLVASAPDPFHMGNIRGARGARVYLNETERNRERSRPSDGSRDESKGSTRGDGSREFSPPTGRDPASTSLSSLTKERSGEHSYQGTSSGSSTALESRTSAHMYVPRHDDAKPESKRHYGVPHKERSHTDRSCEDLTWAKELYESASLSSYNSRSGESAASTRASHPTRKEWVESHSSASDVGPSRPTVLSPVHSNISPSSKTTPISRDTKGGSSNGSNIMLHVAMKAHPPHSPSSLGFIEPESLAMSPGPSSLIDRSTSERPGRPYSLSDGSSILDTSTPSSTTRSADAISVQRLRIPSPSLQPTPVRSGHGREPTSVAVPPFPQDTQYTTIHRSRQTNQQVLSTAPTRPLSSASSHGSWVDMGASDTLPLPPRPSSIASTSSWIEWAETTPHRHEQDGGRGGRRQTPWYGCLHIRRRGRLAARLTADAALNAIERSRETRGSS